MSLYKRLLLLLVLALPFAGSAQDMPEGRLMRFPDIYKDKIVFMYGGDLWLASSSGGDARRITSMLAVNYSRNSLPTENGSPSPDNTTATSMST